MRTLALSCLLAAWLALAASAGAQLPDVPASLAEAALSEQVPGAFAPLSLDVEDFELLPLHGTDPTIRAHLAPGSLKWVRVGKLLRVPRAVAVIETRAIDSGSVAHAGFSHSFVVDKSVARAEIPVALLSSEQSTIEVETTRNGSRFSAGFAVRFRPRAAQRGQVAFDGSCSPYGVSASQGSIPDDSWLYVACRVVRTGHADHTASTLELYLLWDHVGSTIAVDGATISSRQQAVFLQRVSQKPGQVVLSSAGHQVTLSYFISDPLHVAFVGAGIGPALYTFDGPAHSIETVVPLLTLYAGYSFDPSTRLVYFSAVAAHQRGYIGQGLYLWLEQFRAFDERLSMNLLLGANLLIYRRKQSAVTRISAPQGVEFILRDVAGINHNLTVGAFLYPAIAGSAYYDGWIRWGSARYFGELNFLYWREPHSSGSTRSQTLGLSFGMPLLRFL